MKAKLSDSARLKEIYNNLYPRGLIKACDLKLTEAVGWLRAMFRTYPEYTWLEDEAILLLAYLVHSVKESEERENDRLD